MMGRISRVLWRPALLGLSAIVACYFGVAWATAYQPMSEIMVAAAHGVSAVGAIAFTPSALRVLFSPSPPDRESRAVLGLWLIAVSLATNSVWSLWWRLSDQPAYLVNNAVYDGWRLGVIVGMLLLVQAPNLVGRGVSRVSRVAYVAAWAAAVVLVIFLVTARPDLAWLAERAKPYLDNGVGYGGETP